MNCFFGMVDRRKAFSLISSREHCQRSSPSRISDMRGAGFEPAQNLSSGLVEWSCAVVITTTPRRHYTPSSRKRKHGVFCAVYFVQRKFFFNICISSHCIMPWIHFHNINTFTHRKHYFIYFCCLLLKSSKAFSVFLVVFKIWLPTDF